MLGHGGPGDKTDGVARRAGLAVSVDRRIGGGDTIYGEDGQDVLIGGAYGDRIDGGRDEDLILGDNALLTRTDPTSFDATNPRFRTAHRAAALRRRRRAAAADRHLAGEPRRPARLDGLPDHAARPRPRDADGRPARNFGDDFIAGGPGDDQIFGELGNDTIQGDGSIALERRHVGRRRACRSRTSAAPARTAATTSRAAAATT